MSEDVLNFRITYVQRFIPRGYRNPRTEVLHSSHPLAIRRISKEDAPVSHRIVETDGSTAVIRSFDSGYWWPLFRPGGRTFQATPASATMFKSLAPVRNPIVADVLGCHFYDDTIKEEELSAGLPRLLDPEYDIYWECRDGQLKRAKRSAARTIFCGETVLIEGGAPIYYVLDSPSRPGEFSVQAGPSTADTLQGIGIANPYYRLPGPHVADRQGAAALGRAFGPTELDLARSTLAPRANSVTVVNRVDELLPPPTAEAGPRTCAQAFAAGLWADMHDHPDASWRERLRKLVPSLASFKDDGFSPFVIPVDLPHRDILEDYLSLAIEDIQDPYDLRRNAAPAILRRLKLFDPALLAADEEVFAALGSDPSAEWRSAS